MAACPCDWAGCHGGRNRVEESLHLMMYRKEVGREGRAKEEEEERKRGRGRM